MSANAEYDPDYLAATARCLVTENDQLRTALGDLIDALSDEVRLEISRSAHVVEQIDQACRLLGSAYEGYIGGWL